MANEFIDEILKRLLVDEQRSYGEAFERVISERATQIVDLGRIENAYQLFCKSNPKANPSYFRQYIQETRPEDFNKCVRCFNWK